MVFWNTAFRGLTKSFRLGNFGNTLVMTIIFISKYLKFDVNARDGKKNIFFSFIR